nr:MAG TPA: hypothetical protein [Caudoviricetes sp.]
MLCLVTTKYLQKFIIHSGGIEPRLVLPAV